MKDSLAISRGTDYSRGFNLNAIRFNVRLESQWCDMVIVHDHSGTQAPEEERHICIDMSLLWSARRIMSAEAVHIRFTEPIRNY